jgi:transposase
VLDGPAGEILEVGALRAIVAEHTPSSTAPQQTSSVEPWKAKIASLLHEKGAGPTSIHDWLRLNQPGYDGSLSAVKRLCLRLEREAGPKPTDVAIPVITPPGEIAQVDFGYAGKCYDPDRGVRRKCWLFVMTLGFSRHMYCELVFDQKVATWLQLHIRAFEHFGGVPHVIVPDNLKAAVVRAAFGASGDPMINRSYRELAQHYGFQVDPTPRCDPKKKGKVERNVRYVKGNFLATWDSIDIREDNRALARWVAKIAATRSHGTTGRLPIELFEEEERAALLPLPKTRYDLVLWKSARLHTDSHLQIDGAFYSAPWRFLHEVLWVRCTPHSIAIYHSDLHLHTHRRVARGQRSTFEEHLPEHRRDLRHRTRQYWIDRAAKIGHEVVELTEAIFDSDRVLLQLRKVQAIVTHLEKFPAHRARAAAKRAMHFGCLDYVGVKNILSKGLDLQPLVEDSEREWSRGSRFARKPTPTLFDDKEAVHGHR